MKSSRSLVHYTRRCPTLALHLFQPPPPDMAPQVDLVLVFRSSPGKVLSKPQARENARQATQQYTRLLEVLKNGRLQVVGKRGEKEGQLLVLVQCPESTLTRLVQRER